MSDQLRTYELEWGNSSSKPLRIEMERSINESRNIPHYSVLLEKGQDDWFIAKCLDVKGAVSQGKTKDETLRNIVEAISLVLEDEYGKEAPEFFITLEDRSTV